MTIFRACPKTSVVCAYDPDAGLLKDFCRESGLEGYTGLNQMLAEQTLDFAAVFLPHSDCAEAAIQCARAGLHLMIEKPVSNTLEGARRIAETAAECGVKLTAGYCWRYHPAIRRMKDIVGQGLIGRLVSVEARLAAGRVDRYIAGHSAWMLEKSKSGGGPMYNLGVHWLDLIRYMTGETVHEVCAVNTRTSDTYDIEDSSLMLMKFSSGAAGVLTTSYMIPDSFPGGRDLYIGLRGTAGMVSYSPVYQGEQASGTAAQIEILELCCGHEARQLRFEIAPVAGYSGWIGRAYVEGFMDAILEDRAPDIGAGDILAVLRMVEAADESAETGRWVKV